MQQTLTFVLGKTCHRDASPVGHNSGNILFGYIPVLFVALAALIALGLQLFLIVLFSIPQLGSLLKVLCRNGGFLVRSKSVELLFKAREFFGRFFFLHLYTAGSLVHQIDGFVRQESVVDISGREFHCSLQSFISNVQTVVLLILFPQALQNLQCSLLVGLTYGNRLETTLQRGILFDVLAVFIQSCCTDDLDLAAAESRLQNIGGVYGALSGACADNGVQLVDEKDDVTVLFSLLHYLLDTVFKFAAVLSTGYHAGKIQRQQLFVQQLFRHFTLGNFPSQSLGNGRLADTGLTDKTWVILTAAGQDLNYPLNLFITTDDGIQFSCSGVSCQIVGKLRQGLILAAPLAASGIWGAAALSVGCNAEFIHQCCIQLASVHTGRPKNTDCHIVALTKNASQQMLCTNIGIAATNGILHGNFQYMLRSGTQVLGRTAVVRRAGTGGFANHFREQIIRQTGLCQHRMSKSLVLTHQAQ